MIKLSHETLECSPDENGNSHRICIDPYSDKCSKHVETYQAKIFSYSPNKYSDPRHEQKCIAKFPATSSGTAKWAVQEKLKSEMGRKAAAHFMKTVKDSGKQITFTLPQCASLDSVAFCSRKRHKGEYVICEDKLAIFKHFLNSEGRIARSSGTHGNKKTSVKRRSSSVQISKVSTSSDHQYNYGHSPPEVASPAQDLILTPSCPPFEEDDPPSYEEAIANDVGNYPFQTNDNDFNNNFDYMRCFPLTLRIDNCSQLFGCYPPFHTEYCSDIHRGGSNGQLPTTSCHSRLPTTNSADENEEDDCPNPLLSAFIHFSFCQAKGQIIFCNFKGTCHHGHEYILTTPTIHSLTRAYGERDEGEIGMTRVIENHICSRWCRRLQSMREIFEEAQINAISNVSLN